MIVCSGLSGLAAAPDSPSGSAAMSEVMMQIAPACLLVHVFHPPAFAIFGLFAALL